MRSAEDEVRRRAGRLIEAGEQLRSVDRERIADALAAAAQRVASPTTEVGVDARARLPESTGLSSEMVEWALTTALAAATPEATRALARQLAPPRPDAALARSRLAVLVLAGNVFTAPLRALFAPLLAGVPVMAKASSDDDVLPRLLRIALAEVDPEIADAYEVVSFPRGTISVEDALFAQADAVSVFGSDQTVRELRARLPATASLAIHGHGLGAAWVPAAALADEASALRVAEKIALDVAAYDQRGCLSPHAVFAQPGGVVSPERLAHWIADHGLRPLAERLPRGPLSTTAGASQLQWRGVAAARGTLFEGDGYSVSYEGDGPMRLSPGYRNVSVLECADHAALSARLLPLGAHFKALGVAANLDARRRLAARLPPPLSPRISEVGAMQTPPIDSLADGNHPWSGLVRWTQVD